jgi:hypothetical protein
LVLLVPFLSVLSIFSSISYPARTNRKANEVAPVRKARYDAPHFDDDTKQSIPKDPEHVLVTSSLYCTQILRTVYSDEELLRRLQIGEFIGRGILVHAHEAFFDPPLEALDPITLRRCNLDGNRTHGSFVVKLTGTFKRPSKVNKLSPLERASFAVEVIDLLSPHPSIPKVVKHFHNLSNPFRNTTTTATPLLRFLSNDTQSGRWSVRVLEAERLSLTLVEKVVKTHDILSNYIIIVPLSKLRCFWRTLFEALQYIHSRNVVVKDMELWNV